MKAMSLLIGTILVGLALSVLYTAAQTMPTAPAPSGTMMEEKKDAGMATKMEGQTTTQMPQQGMKPGDMKPEMKKDEMGMKSETGNMSMGTMPMEKK